MQRRGEWCFENPLGILKTLKNKIFKINNHLTKKDFLKAVTFETDQLRTFLQHCNIVKILSLQQQQQIFFR